MDPLRLIDSGTSDERELLEAAALDRPARELHQRILLTAGAAVVGLAATSALATGTAAGASAGVVGGSLASGGTASGGLLASGSTIAGAGTVASGGALTSGAATGVATSVGLGGLAKWVGVGLVAGFAATATVREVATPLLLDPPTQRASTPSPRLVTATAAPAEAGPDLREFAPAEQVPPPPSAAAPAATLADEVAAIERARSALSRGMAAESLVALAAYRRSFPAGKLGPEAARLEVEALLRAQRRVEAAQAAHAFLAEHGGTVHAARVRSLLEQATLDAASEARERATPAQERGTPSALQARDRATTTGEREPTPALVPQPEPPSAAPATPPTAARGAVPETPSVGRFSD